MQETENDILKRVRKIEIKTRGLSNEIFAGKYHTAFRGRGMSFSEVREYRAGDDVRDIDWNVTARSRKPHIKVYEEERELTMMLLVDVSASRMFGSTDRLKKNIITEIAAVLAFSAAQNNDKVGCIFFSDRVEKFIPPKKGRSHILMIIRELIGFRPESAGTKLSEPVRFLTNVNKKRCTTFILSDFMDSTGDKSALDDALKIAGSKHDLVGIRVYDPRETELPDVGIVELKDAESGRKVWVDTSSRAVRDHYAASWQRRSGEIEATLKHNRIDTAMISTDGDYEEERELTMMLLVDVSASRMFGSTDRLKKNIITEIAAVLAFSAAQNNDKVGCIFFSDRVEKFIPPKKGRSHILMIIRELIGFRPESAGTKLSEPVRFLTNVNKKRCTTFILSDFMDSTGDKSALDDALKIAGSKHDLVGIRVYDPRETELPDVGIVELKDAESGRKVWVDTSSRAVRDHYAASWQRRSGEIEATLKHNRIDTAMISTDGDYVAELIKLFKQR